MAKSQPVVAGVVKETVTQERYIPEDEVRKNEMAGVTLWDYMEGTTKEIWEQSNISLYVYRDEVKGESYLVRSMGPVDQDFLRDKVEINIGGETVGYGIGGGDFHYYLKRGGERLLEGRFKFAGPVKRFDGIAAGGGGAGSASDMVRIVEMVMNRMKQDNGNGGRNDSPDVLKAAMLGAIEVQNRSMDLMRMQVERTLQAGTPKSGDTPEWAKQLLTAAIPMAIGLIGKMLEPKDAMATIDGLAKAMGALKTLSGEPSEANLGVEIMRSGPGLLRGISDILSEARRAEELRAQTLRLAAVPGAAPAPAVPPAVPPTAPLGATGQPSPEWVWSQVIAMCRNGDDGRFALNFLDQIDPASMKTLRDAGLSLEQLRQMIETGAIHPLLAGMAQLPGYQKFITEFHQALYEPAAQSPA